MCFDLLCYFCPKGLECSEVQLLWQHVAALLHHLQASIQRYEVQSVRVQCSGIPYYLQGASKIILKL